MQAASAAVWADCRWNQRLAMSTAKPMAPSRKIPRASVTNIVTCPLSLRSRPLALLARMVFMDVIPPSQTVRQFFSLSVPGLWD